MTTTNLSIGPFEVHVPDEDWLPSDGALTATRWPRSAARAAPVFARNHPLSVGAGVTGPVLQQITVARLVPRVRSPPG
jgi:hypothetical protein